MSTEVKKQPTPEQHLMQSIQKSIDEGLIVSDGYDPNSAVQSAYLKLMELNDKNGNNVFKVASVPSIVNAVRNMVVMGLHPDKTQGYFIVRGNTLTFMPSYFGMQMMIKRDANVVDVYAQVILNGEELETVISHGEELVVEGSHKRKRVWDGSSSMTRDNIVGAYAIAVFADGSQKHEIMDKAQLDKAWEKSSSNNQGVHNSFPEQMAKRTVINRLSKRILNTSPELKHQQMASAVVDAEFVQRDDEELIAVPNTAFSEDINADADTDEEITSDDVIVNSEPKEDQTEEKQPAKNIVKDTDAPF